MKISSIKLQILNVAKNPLLAGGIIMVVGSNLSNFGQFIYHFISIRLLTTSQYGDLAAMISLIGIFGIIQLSIGLTVVKFIASEKNRLEITNLAKWFNWWAMLAGCTLALIIFFAMPLIIRFFNLSQPQATYLLAPIFLFFIVVYVQRSILQGLLFFNKYVISLLGEMVIRLVLTVFLVLIGWAVLGAMVGILAGIMFGFIVTRMSLNNYVAGKRMEKPKVGLLISYSVPVFLQGLAFTSMYSADLLLVKHFFSPEKAGTYAYLAIMGRVALFGITPITQTMFPLIARRFSHGESYHRIFYISTAVIVCVTSLVVLFYRIFPEFLLGILSKEEGSDMLWWFGIFMGFLGIASHFIQFYLSVGKTKIVWFFVSTALLQIFLIWLVHPTLLTVIQLSIVSAALLVLALIIYFPYHHKQSLSLRDRL